VLLSQVLLNAPLLLIALVASSCWALLYTMMISVGLRSATEAPLAVAPA
jgi:hypothetical protein